jgi:hypothetical protein
MHDTALVKKFFGIDWVTAVTSLTEGLCMYILENTYPHTPYRGKFMMSFAETDKRGEE